MYHVSLSGRTLTSRSAQPARFFIATAQPLWKNSCFSSGFFVAASREMEEGYHKKCEGPEVAGVSAPNEICRLPRPRWSGQIVFRSRTGNRWPSSWTLVISFEKDKMTVGAVPKRQKAAEVGIAARSARPNIMSKAWNAQGQGARQAGHVVHAAPAGITEGTERIQPRAT